MRITFEPTVDGLVPAIRRDDTAEHLTVPAPIHCTYLTKGDTWGGLGWIYTAGTYGLHRYLAAKAVPPNK